jgi:hypothetical protein
MSWVSFHKYIDFGPTCALGEGGAGARSGPTGTVDIKFEPKWSNSEQPSAPINHQQPVFTSGYPSKCSPSITLFNLL